MIRVCPTELVQMVNLHEGKFKHTGGDLKPWGKRSRKSLATPEQKLSEPEINEVSIFHFRTPPLISI